MKMKRRLMQEMLAAAIAVAALSVAGSASAQPSPGQNFGGHVASCARDMGFDSAHNPGLHQGAAGWPGS